MFKKKKTYIDKINFDLFEDNEPDDFDLFSKESVEHDDIEDNGIPEDTGFSEDTELSEDNEIADDSEILEDSEITEDNGISEESDESEHTFSYEDFDNIEKELDEKSRKKNREKKKKSKGKTVFLVFLWLIIFGAGVVAFLYFKTDIFRKKKNNTATDTDASTTVESYETTEELDEGFYTIYSYETNADVNINALMADYYDALVKGDSEKLKDIVTEPESFGDMMIYETKAQVISEYSNITCYTIPGLNENEILVFTTSNVTITGVNSKPLDIKQFYVVKDGNNYKINNGVLSQEVIDYINVQAGSPDVQALYKSVQDNINQCLAEDSTFADFYNKISTNTNAE